MRARTLRLTIGRVMQNAMASVASTAASQISAGVQATPKPAKAASARAMKARIGAIR